MEFDLQRGLHDLSGAPTIGPDAVPTAPVLRRVHRGRTLRAAAAGVASVIVVAGVAAVVHAAPWQAVPPVQTPAPTVEPSPTVEPTPDTSPTPDPTPAETATANPIVALTVAYELVEMDPDTGEVLRVIATDDAWTGPISVSPDREYAYVGAAGDVTFDSIYRVSLRDGTADVVVEEGSDPAISPDGRTLAYVGLAADPGSDGEVAGCTAVALLDLDSGEHRFLPDSERCLVERNFERPAWSADGSLLYVSVGWSDAWPPANWIVAVDPGTSLQDGLLLEPAVPGEEMWAGWREPTLLADGRLAVFGYTGGGADWWAEETDYWTGSSHLAILDPDTSEVVQRIETPGMDLIDLAAPTGGERLAILTRDPTSESREGSWFTSGLLYRWDAEGGLRQIAQDVMAVDW